VPPRETPLVIFKIGGMGLPQSPAYKPVHGPSRAMTISMLTNIRIG